MECLFRSVLSAEEKHLDEELKMWFLQCFFYPLILFSFSFFWLLWILSTYNQSANEESGVF